MKTISNLMGAILMFTVCLGVDAKTDASLFDLKSTLSGMHFPLEKTHTRNETIIEDGERIKTVTKITPNNTIYWELLSYNGRTPSKKEIKKHKKRMKQEIKDMKKDSFISVLNLNSMKHLKSTDTHEVYEFNPVFSNFSKSEQGDVIGRITTDKDGAIIRIKMGAPKAFKPSFGMNIMLFSLDYEVSYHNSIPYVEDSKMVIKISDGGVKNLLIESSASIQDIQW